MLRFHIYGEQAVSAHKWLVLPLLALPAGKQEPNVRFVRWANNLREEGALVTGTARDGFRVVYPDGETYFYQLIALADYQG